MTTEFEAKFCNVDHDEVRGKLKELGAKLVHPMRLMQRVTIDNDFMKTGKDAFIRIRNQGDKTTITYKQFDDLSVDGAKEIEVEVDDFENAVSLFAEAGLPHRSFQESKRETWELDDCMIELDEWPWLNPYIEIEGQNSDEVKNAAIKLGYEWDDAVFGDVMAAYRVQYPHLTEKDTVGNIESVRFGDELPKLFKK
jgi:adenylate cyclase class 2